MIGSLLRVLVSQQKTLICAKDDDDADRIGDLVREVFEGGKEFCKKMATMWATKPWGLENREARLSYSKGRCGCMQVRNEHLSVVPEVSVSEASLAVVPPDKTRETIPSSSPCHDFEGIITDHPMMMRLLQMVARVAPTRATVLLRGETGTGKELIARALHANSDRKNQPYVVLHLAGLQQSVVDAELFGHVKGAFTGADRNRPGRIQSAAGGTLFIDEIAETPLQIQAKLLRFLQFGEIQPVGSDQVENVDVRVIAATHQDLSVAVKHGRFRQDLYFRLKVIELKIPPLRERVSDIPILVDALLRRHWSRSSQIPTFTQRAKRLLHEYNYPGNVRELCHLIERACILTEESPIDVDMFPADMRASSPTIRKCDFVNYTAQELSLQRRAAVVKVELDFITGLMARHAGNVSEAARQAGLHRSYLQRLLARHKG